VRIEVNTSEFDRAYALVQQWQKRSRAVQRQFLYRAVDGVYDDILGLLPSDRRELRKSIKMQRIRGLPDSACGYVIRSVPKGAAVSKAEISTTVIYVEAKSNLMRSVPVETALLEEFSPWTVETLPYAPDPKTAKVISRRVSTREVVQVRQMRLRDKPTWRRRMVVAGIKMAGSGLQPRPGGMEAIPDVAFESLRLEFGLGGEPSKPHWRRAVLQLALRGGAGMIARKREFIRAMTDPTFTAWEQWPRRTRGFVTVAEAKRYVPFQKRLGIRVGNK